MKELTAQYLAEFCSELTLLVRSGVSPSDGLELMRDDDDDKSSRALLSALVTLMETQPPLSSRTGEMGSFKSQFKTADASGARFALVFGADELAEGCVTIKQLRDGAGEQSKKPLAELAQWANSLQSQD